MSNDSLLWLMIFLLSLALLVEDTTTPSECTESFCKGDKVSIIDTAKQGVITQYKGDHSNKVWQIYVDNEKLFYTIPENRLTKEE